MKTNTTTYPRYALYKDGNLVCFCPSLHMDSIIAEIGRGIKFGEYKLYIQQEEYGKLEYIGTINPHNSVDLIVGGTYTHTQNQRKLRYIGSTTGRHIFCGLDKDDNIMVDHITLMPHLYKYNDFSVQEYVGEYRQ